MASGYTPVLGTSVAGLWDDFHGVWKPLGAFYLPDAFDTSTGQQGTLNYTAKRIGYYSGGLSSGSIAYFLGGMVNVSTYKPSTYSASGITFASGPGYAWDASTSTKDMIICSSNYNSTGYVTYSGFGSGVKSGTLRITYNLTSAVGVNFDEVEFPAAASLSFTTNGSNTTFVDSFNNGTSTGVVTREYNLTNVDLSTLQVTVDVQTTRQVNPTQIIKSSVEIYNIEFVG